MSSNYKALTRAYRPQTFEDIVSQEHVSNTLKNAISNSRLSHAYLFCGPRGVGKTTMARVLARTINEVGADVDGEELNNTLNIIEIDAASNNSVDDIRSLRERVRIPPQNGRYKVYIIDEIHMLSKSAFNALLKTLEEPPEHVIFIFATTEPHRILPTILSRCQRFDFRRITVDEIVDRLRNIADKEKIQIDTESLHVIAKKADGALRDALGIFDQAIAFCGTSITYEDLHRALNIVSSERMFELTDTLARQDASAGMALLHHLLHIGNDIQEFLGALTEHFRNLYLAKDTQNFYLIEATDETKQRFHTMAADFSDDDLMRMMHILHEAQFSIRNSQQPRIHLEITLLKLFHMIRTDGLKQLLVKLDALEQKVNLTGENESGTGNNTSQAAPGAAQSSKPDTGTSAPAATSKPASKPGTGNTAQNRTTPTDTAIHTGPETTSRASGTGTRYPGTTVPNSPQPDKSVSDSTETFGAPSLRSPKNHLTAVSLPVKPDSSSQENEVRGNLALSPKPAPAPDLSNSSDPDGHSRKVELEKVSNLLQIEEIWSDYLQQLQSTAGQMLYYSMQKTRPVELKGDQVTLECPDSFTSDIIHEQQRKLCDIIREHFGFALRFTSRIVETTKRTDTIEDPYEQLSMLLKKDTTLKKIVDLFGAELEY